MRVLVPIRDQGSDVTYWETDVVLIFGWGNGRAEDQGEVVPVRCPNCHNDVVLHEVRSKKQISLFFVPVVPYGTDEYLACPICGKGLQLRPDQHGAVEAMRMATASFRRGSLPEAAYRARIDGFWRSMGVTMPGGAIPFAAGSNAPAPAHPLAAVPSQASPSVLEAPLADRIANLARLHAAGILTDDEFGAAKSKLLER